MSELFFIIGSNEEANEKMSTAFSYEFAYQKREYKTFTSPSLDLDIILSKRTDVLYQANKLTKKVYFNFENALSQNYITHTVMIFPQNLMEILKKHYSNSEDVSYLYSSIPYFFAHSYQFIIYSYTVDTLRRIRIEPCLEKNSGKTYRTFAGSDFGFKHIIQRLMRAYKIKCDNSNN